MRSPGRAGQRIRIKLTLLSLCLANVDYSPGFSAAFDSAMIPPPPPENLHSPLTRTSSVSMPHPPPTHDTRRIQSMQPSLSVPSSLRDPNLEDNSQTGYDAGLQDSPVVPTVEIPQLVEEVHVFPLPCAKEDKKLSTSRHSYGKSDLWPWTRRNAAILVDGLPEPPSPSVSPSIDNEVGTDPVVDIGPANSTSTNAVVEGSENERALSSSYLPDMATPSSGSVTGDGTDPPVSIIASEDSEEQDSGHERNNERESRAGSEGQVPPSPAPSDVPEMPVFLPAKSSTLSLDKHGSVGSFVARKSSFFKSHISNSSHDKRSSMPLPSAVIASLLPWRGSRRPSSEPELPSQSSKAGSRLSSSLPSPH